MEAAAYPAWLVPSLGVICAALIGFCGALLSVLVYLYRQDSKSNSGEHWDLFRLVSGIRADVRVLLERTGGPAPRDAGTARGSRQHKPFLLRAS